MAKLKAPAGIAVDAAGNFYFSDSANDRVLKVDTSGQITIVAGNGTPGFSGDGIVGGATNAMLSSPRGVVVDTAGTNLYVADTGNSVVRRVTPLTGPGTITTVAGNTTPDFGGDGGPATSAMLKNPEGVALNAAGNELYIGDTGNNRIRKVVNPAPNIPNPPGAGIITTVAGNGTSGFSGDGLQAISAELDGPTGVALGPTGNLFIADTSNNRIREVLAQQTPTSGPPTTGPPTTGPPTTGPTTGPPPTSTATGTATAAVRTVPASFLAQIHLNLNSNESNGKNLAKTGQDIVGFAMWGVWMLAGGILALRAGRRPRRTY
jgi:sugar lactone lactonase YvrE